MRALKITADRIALADECRCMTFRMASCGYFAAKIAGIMAKYLATSFAMLNVVNEPRVIRICLPISTMSNSLVGFESRSTRFAACLLYTSPSHETRHEL